MTRRLGTAILALGLAGVAAWAVTAPAATPKFASQVHMHAVGPSPEYDHWVGDVHSRKRKCRRGRTVTVYYDEPEKSEAVGTDTTDRRGHWQIPLAVPGDDPYHAEVSRKVVGTGDNRIVCKAGRSPGFGFPPFS